jgi:arabinose-5-phosphate isomerase
VQLNTTIKDVIIEMTSKRLGVTAVLNDEKKITGIITDGDLRRMLQRNDWAMHTKAEEIMTSNPVLAHADMLAIEGLRLMQQKNISQLLVTSDGNYVGVVHVHDMIKEGII